VLLSNESLEAASVLAGDIQRAFEAQRCPSIVEGEDSYRVDVSIGIAADTGGEERRRQLLLQADRNMYDVKQAKRTGMSGDEE